MTEGQPDAKLRPHLTMFEPSTIIYFPVLAAALFGLIVGSFANVCIHRIPLEESIVFPASRCPQCRAKIAPWQNLPVLSWIVLLGRCASCREPISIRYPLVEAIHGIGFGALVLAFGITPFTPFLFFLFFLLTILAFIDWDHQILPDVLTLPGLAIGVAGTWVPGALVGWKEACLSAALGYVAFFLVAEGYARLRGIEGLGQGDWKLAAMIGSFLGGQHLLLVVFLGSLSGMLYGLAQATRLRARPALEPSHPNREGLDVDHVPAHPSIGKYKLPFGTFLAASAVFVLFFGDAVLLWYGSFFRF